MRRPFPAQQLLRGRGNGQLALHHHGKLRLSNRKIAVLNSVHDYFIRRPEGTTAAQRFFGQPPTPMFEYLLAALDPPPRQARKRVRPQRVAYLEPMAA